MRRQLEVLIRRALRYGVVGLLSVAIFYIFLPIMRETLGLSSFVAGASCSVLASALSYSINYSWAFQSTRKHAVSASRYAAVLGLNILLNGVGVWILVDKLHLDYGAVTLALVLTIPALNFVLYNWWAFGDGT